MAGKIRRKKLSVIFSNLVYIRPIGIFLTFGDKTALKPYPIPDTNQGKIIMSESKTPKKKKKKTTHVQTNQKTSINFVHADKRSFKTRYLIKISQQDKFYSFLKRRIQLDSSVYIELFERGNASTSSVYIVALSCFIHKRYANFSRIPFMKERSSFDGAGVRYSLDYNENKS